MFRNILVNGNETKFQCSAATGILYKRLFGKSLPSEMGKLAEAGRNAQRINERLHILREKEDTDPQELIDLLSEDSSLMELSAMTQEIVPQMAYIMWLEGNFVYREINQRLTMDSYIEWLTKYESNDIINISSEIFELWNGTNKTNSNLKNA